MNNTIEVYHYGDCGEYDEFNPFKIIEKKGVPEILYVIGKSLPFTINMSALNRILKIDNELLSLYISEMTSLNMIEEKLGYYSTNFTIIFNEDLQEIDSFSKSLALEISGLINENKVIIQNLSKKLVSAEDFNSDELLYHIIGCDILDGSAIETLDSFGLIKTSKEQKGNRDYILFGFEKCPAVDDFSKNILCSCNNYRTSKLSFISFGDSDGNRNDFYRFSRQLSSQVNQIETSQNIKSSYMRLLEKANEDIGERCASMIHKIIKEGMLQSDCSEDEHEIINYLLSFGYIKLDSEYYKIAVPVFYPQDEDIIREIHDLLMDIILPVLKNHFQNWKITISANNHGVDIKEILNEMWHQIFGNINENLVIKKIIKTPDYFKGEGRYLKAIYLK